jgi:drug/metabolite transporter (DMT)-like permease
MLVVLRPGAAVFEPASLLAVLSALCYAVSQTITRRLGRSDSGATMALTATALSVGVAAASRLIPWGSPADGRQHPSLAFLTRAWVWPPPGHLGLMGACGLTSSIGSYCLAQAYRLAPAGAVAPFEYLMIGWAVLWGYLLWGDVPGPLTLIGVALTIGAGLFVLRDEAATRSARRPRDAAAS